MNVEKLSMDRTQARALYRQYKAHVNQQTPEDREIQQIYRRIAAGFTVVRALASITAAGLNEAGQPKLAICRADDREIDCGIWQDAVIFTPRNVYSRSRDRRFTVGIPGANSSTRNCRAIVPLIPVHLRPKADLSNYHILWEAEWRGVPVDPYLLRRFAGDAWLVVAAWDLTPVERAVMAQRLHA